MFSTTQRIGILGGGQLGKMLCLAAAPWDLKIFVLDTSADLPAATVCTGFNVGNFNDFEDVMVFGSNMDIITIEIEHVNVEALKALEAAGKIVYPQPAALEIIQDKGLQKQFYAAKGIPTADFQLFDSEEAVREAVRTGALFLPFVQKSRTAGYDGKGVAVIRTVTDLSEKLLPGACLIEDLVDVQVEIAVIAARNPQGDIVTFPAVEMEFHPEANLVELLMCPANLSNIVEAQAEALAESVIEAFGLCGLLAVEMFLTKDGRLLVNEVAPRPHNSGHHTIDSAVTNQFQQHLRAIMGFSLGDTTALVPAVMLNVLGEPGHSGPVQYEGVEECLGIPGVHLHLYGKAKTTPFRKMGHITVTADTLEAAVLKARQVKSKLKVVSQGAAD